MPIATFGYKTFEVSSNKIYTFDGMSRNYGLDTESQEQEGNKPSTYIKGHKLTELNFTIKLDARFVDVENELKDWENICKSKTPYYFILGGKALADNKFLLLSGDESEPRINNLGKYLSCSLSLKFQEFIRYGHKEDENKKKKKKEKPDYVALIDTAQKRNNTSAQQSYAEGTKEW